MNGFLQTLAIAVLPSIVTGLLSFWASSKDSKTRIETIEEQNKADIEKLIQQNKVDIESLKEKHRLEMEKKDKEYQHQIELINLQHKNELQKDEENVKNQMTANVIGGLLGGIFSEQSPVSNRLNEVISNALEEVEKKEEK